LPFNGLFFCWQPQEVIRVQWSPDLINPLEHPICFSHPARVAFPTGWVEHIPFAMLLVDIVRPQIFVELGTHSGNSYCAFCQAIKALDLPTKSFAVDTWEGDVHAGAYGLDVLDDLRAHHDPLYGSFSRLVQSTFDEAVGHFSDQTIDLLHIDGLHTYEAVKHDFETWLPKISARGIVLFHDTNVRERDFGVWRFWQEVISKYPGFEFYHGNGLGIACVGRDSVPVLKSILSLPESEMSYFHEFFFTLGNKIFQDWTNIQLSKQNEELRATIHQLDEGKQQLETQLAETNTRLAEKEIHLNNILKSRSWKLILQLQKARSKYISP
jgi:O-antigen biosynthesis protein